MNPRSARFSAPETPGRRSGGVGPLLGEEGVLVAVEPPAAAVQAVAARVVLPAHAELLHDPPARLVLHEAAGGHAAQAEVPEADLEGSVGRLGGVAQALVGRSDHPSALGLDA